MLEPKYDMAGKENRQCPQFNIHNGVCGCPEFWIPARSTVGNQSDSSVNYIPLLNRTKTKTEPVTPAPPGPPKETCFFWYHRSCRRGNECDRPHEAHPPSFRRYQSCMLPLCPLRADLKTTKKSQEYQRRGRTISGQIDGAAFSGATTSSGSSGGIDSSGNTNTDTTKDDEHASLILHDRVVGVSALYDCALQAPARDVCGEETDQEGGVVLRQGIGSHEPDYIDLSQLLSPPSTPFVQEEASLSISHSGTLGKRRQSPSPDVNKRVKLAEDIPPDLSNIISILERPRMISYWDIKPSGSGTDRSHIDTEAAHLALMRSSSPQPNSILAANNNFTSSAPQSFEPPKGPRGTSLDPPICFFFYHKGYCNPKRGQRCDYLHNMDTFQQTVSLPTGIDNHSPMCSLQLCPVRLQYCGQKRQEPALSAAATQPETKYEPITSPNMSSLSFHRHKECSLNDKIITMQGRYPRVMPGQPLPQLTGVAMQRFKMQTQLGGRIASTEFAATFGLEHRIQGKKKARRRRKGGKRQTHANAAECSRPQMKEADPTPQGRNSHSDAFGVQRSLYAFPVKEESSTPIARPPVGDLDNTRREPENHNKKLLHSQRAKQPHFEKLSKDKGFRGAVQDWTVQGFSSSSRVPVTQDAAHAVTRNESNHALEILQTMNEDSHRWWPLSKDPQNGPSSTIVTHEYSQASLGFTREERLAATGGEQQARRQVFYQGQGAEQEKGKAVREKKVRPAASGASPDEAAVGTNSAVEYRLPEGGERLDWDTDLVRRLFGEMK